MVVQRGSSLMSEANKQVHICEELLAITSTVSTKIFLSIMEHGARAIAYAAQAATGFHGAEEAIKDLAKKEEIPHASEAAELYDEIQKTLEEYRAAQVVFERRERLIAAADEFEKMRDVTLSEVENQVDTIKGFVYQVGKRILLDEVPVGETA